MIQSDMNTNVKGEFKTKGGSLKKREILQLKRETTFKVQLIIGGVFREEYLCDFCIEFAKLKTETFLINRRIVTHDYMHAYATY